MSKPIEDYALLSDCYTSALVSKDGSIDWLCLPHFDSPACFASLLGDDENGRWKIGPKGNYEVTRRYLEGTMILETEFVSSEGSCKIIDCMLVGDKSPTLVRTVEGVTGTVNMELDIVIRFDYGSIIPWVRRNEDERGIHAVGGPDAVVLYTPYEVHGRSFHTKTEFSIKGGERKCFTLIWYPSHRTIPLPLDDPWKKVNETMEYWRSWSSKCSYTKFDEKSVKRSLITLKALTYEPTGAILAAPTTSLPESLGGVRNWDYRYGWLRDSSLALYALLKAGYIEEANRWEKWLHNAVAGTPSQMNIMYGLRGERRLTEVELPWLKGYENSRPVRIGNGAYNQLQLDVFGELLFTSHLARKNGLRVDENTWRIERKMIQYVCEHWGKPDEGIWEVRGPRRHFTHSKLMAWVALNYAVEFASAIGSRDEASHWLKVRDKIHADICTNGFNSKLNSFVQYYGSSHLDASLLMMGHVNFLPANDPRMVGTVEAIQKHLTHDGHVYRYIPDQNVDGLPGEEGTFIACSFWLVDNLLRIGRREEALELYQNLQTIKNDVGLYAEEYSVKDKRMVGNYPQAFSHIGEAVSAMGFDDAHKDM
jgi:GH15 family glucan-1,4-alpha-glucosidase